jgi:polysaccharide biosynthesis transport protein
VNPGLVTFGEMVAFVRRRKKLLFIPPVVITGLCVLLAFLLPRKYESSTTIWVQRDEILNPLVSFTMAVQMASEDRLRAFNEIIMSRQTMEMLIDSLGLAKGTETPIARDDIVDLVRASVRTERRGSDSFVITYTDTDPVRAQRAVTILADHFISTRLWAERTRNDETVNFFSGKLQEYEKKFGETEDKVVSLLKKRMQKIPTTSSSLGSNLDAMDRRIRELEDKVRSYQRARIDLDMFPSAFGTEQGGTVLAELLRADLPYNTELRALLSRHDSLVVRYTVKYPEIGKLEGHILELLKRSQVFVESEIDALNTQLGDERKRRTETINEMTLTSIAQREDQDKESNYAIYKQLYNDMKVKMEQAKIAQELGRRAQNQFIIIDPPRVPAKPTKPSRALIVLGGMTIGIMLGVLAALVGEHLDTTIRTSRQLEVYQKPIIAVLPPAVRVNIPMLKER